MSSATLVPLKLFSKNIFSFLSFTDAFMFLKLLQVSDNLTRLLNKNVVRVLCNSDFIRTKTFWCSNLEHFFLANIYGRSKPELGKSQINSGKRALTRVRPSQSDRFPLLCRPSIHYERPTNSQFTKWLIPTNSFSESICQEDQDISFRYHLFPPVDWFALNEKWFFFPAQPSSWMIHIWQSKLRV